MPYIATTWILYHNIIIYTYAKQWQQYRACVIRVVKEIYITHHPYLVSCTFYTVPIFLIEFVHLLGFSYLVCLLNWAEVVA